MRSIGKILSAQRDKKKLALDDVYKAIRIHPRFIKALENDDYEAFSGKVHSKGFLKVYAGYLELNVDEIMALWRREYEISFEKNGKSVAYSIKPVETSGLIITPGLVLGIFFSTVLLIFFGYLYYQYRTYTGAPMLDIYYPDNNVVLSSDILDITGKTDLDSQVSINNQKIMLNMDGSFVASLKLKEGLNTISIKSINKLEKQTEVLRSIIYRPESVPEPVSIPESTQSTKSF